MAECYPFACSAQGYNHIKADKVCQDASGTRVFEDVAFVAVADGHGNENYIRTDRGSRFAVQAALESMETYIREARANQIEISERTEEQLTQITKNILARWHALVEEDVIRQPFQEDELVNVSDRYRQRYATGRYNPKAYGTTLIAACQTKDEWFAIQIGDGKCIELLPDGEICEPVPWDEDCVQNITTSICDDNALEEFRYAWGKQKPAALFLGSDGIDDSYASESELHELYRSIYLVFNGYGQQVGEQEVIEHLPKITRRGSGDDVSIAGILSLDLSPEEIQKIRLCGERISLKARLEQAQREHQRAIETKNYIETHLGKNREEYQKLREKMTAAEQKLCAAEEMLYQVQAEWKALKVREETSQVQSQTSEIQQEKAVKEELSGGLTASEGKDEEKV